MTLKNKLKRNLQYIVFCAMLSAWLVSLLAVYLPVSRWGTPTFPSTIDNKTLMVFLVTAGLSSFSSLYVGFNMLGINSRIKVKVQGINQTSWFKSFRMRWNTLTKKRDLSQVLGRFKSKLPKFRKPDKLREAEKRIRDSWTSLSKTWFRHKVQVETETHSKL